MPPFSFDARLVMSSLLKFQEAAFFIELLAALEELGGPLTHGNDAAMETSFLFAAILNSFYSSVEMLEVEGVRTKSFRANHPEIYAYGSKGGKRAETVRIAHAETAHSGYIPPKGNNVNLTFRQKPRLAQAVDSTPGQADLAFRSQHYVLIELRGSQEHAFSFCEEHYSQLVAFHRLSTAT